MKTIIIIPLFILLLASCNSKRVQDNTQQETPKALQEKVNSYEIATKRSYDDLVEDLYKEILTKDIQLKRLEELINQLTEGKSDSTKSFDTFNEKNKAYFSSADIHVGGIKDSLVREKMKTLVGAQLAKYNSTIIKHDELLKLIETKQIKISDLHNVLKIVKTLPIIAKYQSDNLPTTASLESYTKQQEEAIKLADKLSKK